LNHDGAAAHMSLLMLKLSTSMKTTFPTLLTHPTLPPVIVSYFQKWNWSSRSDVLRALNLNTFLYSMSYYVKCGGRYLILLHFILVIKDEIWFYIVL
jgi:hypothetical protein